MQGEGAATLQYLLCWHICQISVVLINIALLTKLKKIPTCQQIGLKQSLFVEKLGLCAPPNIFFSFAPGPLGLIYLLRSTGTACTNIFRVIRHKSQPQDENAFFYHIYIMHMFLVSRELGNAVLLSYSELIESRKKL